MKNLESFGVQELDTKGISNTNGGGIIILIGSAFLMGVAYGYAKEKIDSGQW